MKHNVPKTKTEVSLARRISRKISLFLNKLAPPGYEDALGFHFGVVPVRRRHHARPQSVVKNKLRPRPKTKARPRTHHRFDYKASPDSLITMHAV